MARPSSREAILDAAEEVVIELGGARLTLEAVAERAGISKGGVLYNFPSKDALVVGMAERLMGQYREQRTQVMERVGGSDRAAVLRAHIEVFVSCDRRCEKVGAGLLAAVANQPDLMARVRDIYRGVWEDAVGSGESFSPEAALVFLATEGLNFLQMMNMSPLDDASRGRVIEAMRDIARGQ